MLDELKELKYFKEITDFKNLKCKTLQRNTTFEKFSKSRGVLRNQACIYDEAFLGIYLTAYYSRNKTSVIDVSLVYI